MPVNLSLGSGANGFRERPLRRPPEAQSRCDNRGFYAEFFSPGRHALRFPVESQQAVAPRVAVLDFRRRPPTVVRGVAFFVVNAVDGVPRRGPYPHIGIEVLELHPPLADSDAPPAVTRVRLARCVQASRLDPAPYPVFRAVRPAVCVAVSWGSSGAAIALPGADARHARPLARRGEPLAACAADERVFCMMRVNHSRSPGTGVARVPPCVSAPGALAL
jgi:hypothetical protein